MSDKELKLEVDSIMHLAMKIVSAIPIGTNMFTGLVALQMATKSYEKMLRHKVPKKELEEFDNIQRQAEIELNNLIDELDMEFKGWHVEK